MDTQQNKNQVTVHYGSQTMTLQNAEAECLYQALGDALNSPGRAGSTYKRGAPNEDHMTDGRSLLTDC